jgi:hypothetical protein
MIMREENDPENPDLRVRITIGDQPPFASPLTTTFQANRLAKTVADIFGFIVPVPGILRFVIQVGDVELASWSIRIEQVGAPPMEIHPVINMNAEQPQNA